MLSTSNNMTNEDFPLSSLTDGHSTNRIRGANIVHWLSATIQRYGLNTEIPFMVIKLALHSIFMSHDSRNYSKLLIVSTPICEYHFQSSSFLLEMHQYDGI